MDLYSKKFFFNTMADNTISVDDMRGCKTPKGTSKSLKGYKIPKGEEARLGIKECTSMKSGKFRKTITEELANSSKTPGCQTYKNTKHVVWTTLGVSTDRPRLKWTKTPKVTSLE